MKLTKIPKNARFSHYESTKFNKIEVYYSKRKKYYVVYERYNPRKIYCIFSIPVQYA